MTLTSFSGICPKCDRRYGPPNPRGAEIKPCLPCLKGSGAKRTPEKRKFTSYHRASLDIEVIRNDQIEEVSS